jgi:nucleoside-diphosphate-sugar epimerase/2-polyprenyl-3-methyl-5-hydroxy-6-metoxy-1,4-benzoquinol methylase
MNVPDQRFWDVNVKGTENILEASVNAGVKRFVHGSTIGVYGNMKGTIDEQSPCKPDNIYGKTKLEGEKLVLTYKDKLPVVVIRIPEVYGPGDRRLLKLFKAIKKSRFFMIGNGGNMHHLIFIDDLIEGFFLASTSEKAIGKVFLLAGKEAISTNEMVTIIAEQLGTSIPKIRIPLFPMIVLATVIEKILRPCGIQPPIHRRRMDFFRKSFTLSWENASDFLKFTPKFSFSQGASKTVKSYREANLLQGKLKMITGTNLTAKTEPFDSFWEAPEDIEKGYYTFGEFYKANYLKYIPNDKNCHMLFVSCGYGYFLNLLKKDGYTNVLGIDLDPEKVEYATRKKLNCRVEESFPFLENNKEQYDLIFCEQEINHLTKDEILEFLKLCWNSLRQDGVVIIHSLNGGNPITGIEALAQNFDHYNTFTEYSLRQILNYSNFNDVDAFPLNLYVFRNNPMNYVGKFLTAMFTLFFKVSFMLYGKSNKIFTKKIAAIGRKT